MLDRMAVLAAALAAGCAVESGPGRTTGPIADADVRPASDAIAGSDGPPVTGPPPPVFRPTCAVAAALGVCVSGARLVSLSVRFDCGPAADPLGPGTRRWRSIGGPAGSPGPGTYACGESEALQFAGVPCDAAGDSPGLYVIVALDPGDPSFWATCGWDRTGPWSGTHTL